MTKCSLVRPKIVRSVHYCAETKKMTSMEYRDGTSLVGAPTTTVPPSKDTDGHPLSMEFGLSIFKSHQTITIQEMPEVAPLGQLPRSVDVVLELDLVDKCKPGDRIQVTGIYRPVSNAITLGNGASQHSGKFTFIL